jgi:acyl transferase domain-containing protein
MIAIGLSAASVQAYLDKVEIQPGHHGLNVSCISSPQNITVSGEQIYIDALEVLLQQDEIFARKLPVMVAYHSAQMLEIAEEYLQQIGIIESEDRIIKGVYMISTVTGQPIDKTELLRGE